ncbi:hypothetical protein CFAM422_003927 [Trichoderma lentiforme]|uniref:Uncharacterized protein n=1 Tax=Trichoderma lentiforme TaxID=1567552 RepID=A0A9P4XIX9_9HYPO|nr:hypothetical protein CFAM422_003927 [Trichoderma lentiforme]
MKWLRVNDRLPRIRFRAFVWRRGGHESFRPCRRYLRLARCRAAECLATETGPASGFEASAFLTAEAEHSGGRYGVGAHSVRVDEQHTIPLDMDGARGWEAIFALTLSWIFGKCLPRTRSSASDTA